MVSFHISQLVTAAKQTNVTKSELLEMVKEKFDGNVYFVFFNDNDNICLIILFVLHCFHYTSAYQVDNPLSVEQGSVLGTEGTFVLFKTFYTN